MGLSSVMGGEALFLCVYKAFTPLLRLWQKGRKCACIKHIMYSLHLYA